MFSKLMIPVDLAHTESLGKALETAASLAKGFGAEAHLVGVTMTSPGRLAKTPEEFAAKLASYAADCANKFDVPFRAHTEISHDIRIDLDDILQRAAEKIGADLIIMASHVPGFAEHVFASNAGYLASHSDLSVLVVR